MISLIGGTFLLFMEVQPPHLRLKLWRELTHENLIHDNPWVAIGDFNVVIAGSETTSVSGR